MPEKPKTYVALYPCIAFSMRNGQKCLVMFSDHENSIPRVPFLRMKRETSFKGVMCYEVGGDFIFFQIFILP